MLTAGSDGQYLHGWEQQFGFLSTKWADVPVLQRVPQAMWRGRTEDPDFPKRDELRSAPAATADATATVSMPPACACCVGTCRPRRLVLRMWVHMHAEASLGAQATLQQV